MNMKAFFVFSISVAFYACEHASSPNAGGVKIDTLFYRELSEGEIPPCLNKYASFDNLVLRGQRDYDSIRTRHAPQGGYEQFTANGIQTRFRLSYQPLDDNCNGKIDPTELVIYMRGIPIYVTYHDSLVKVSTYPFFVIDDSVLIFNDRGFLQLRIPCGLVFSVDSVTGEVLFVSPPPSGNQLSICGARRLYNEFEGRACNMDYFDFSEYSIIEKELYSYYPNPILIGIRKQIIKDPARKIIIYRYKPIFGIEPSLEESSYRTWVAVHKIPNDYSVRFEEME